MRIIPLGTSGWIPTKTRETMCLCLEDDMLLFFDAGTGICRFGNPQIKKILESHDDIHIVLSHFHLDHIIGITYLPAFFEGKKINFYGPGPSISGYKTENVVRMLCSSPIFPIHIEDFPFRFEFFDLKKGINELSGFKLHIIPQEHSDPSIAIKYEDIIVYATDTCCSMDMAIFAERTKLLIHECFLDKRNYEILRKDNTKKMYLESHSFSLCVASIAQKAEVSTLILTHLNPTYSEERLKNMLLEIKKENERTILPTELSEIHIF